MFFTCIHLFCCFFYVANIFPFLFELGVVRKLVKCKMILGIMTMRYVAIGWRRHLKKNITRIPWVSVTFLKECRFPYLSFCKLLLICQISDSVIIHSSITLTRDKIALKPNPVIISNPSGWIMWYSYNENIGVQKIKYNIYCKNQKSQLQQGSDKVKYQRIPKIYC